MRSMPHLVIACGTVWAASRLLDRLRGEESTREVVEKMRAVDSPVPLAEATSSTLDSVAIDYRLVALGSLLPDLVDKALGRYLLRDRLDGNDHTLGHTFLFNLAILLPGLAIVARRGDPRLLSVGIAAFTHLLVDPVIRAPRTIFWPLFGLEFPHVRGLGPLATVATQAAAALVMFRVARTLREKRALGRFLSAGRL